MKKKWLEQLGTGVIFSNDWIMHKKYYKHVSDCVQIHFCWINSFFDIDNLIGKSAGYVAFF